ncbi:MAG TPA: hypothetical protein VE053_06785 [Allosphingosinicella sp.]|nr:hypothetical protein [Allosphingosinicella sp.]
MSGVISTALRHLMAAGVTGEALLRAVEDIEAAIPTSVDEAAERRRERDRLYQAERRRQKSADSADLDDASVSCPPNEYISNPPVPPVEASASTAPKGRDRGSKIPEDWNPPSIAELTPEARSLAEKWPAASYRAEAEAFRNFWLAESGARARKSNWDRAWANRIVAVSGQVMRQAKFAEPETKFAKREMDPAETSALAALTKAKDQLPFDEWCKLRDAHYRRWPPPGKSRSEDRRTFKPAGIGDLTQRIQRQATA